MKTGGYGEGRVGDGQKMCNYRLASVRKAWQSTNLPLAPRCPIFHARPSYSPYIPSLKRRDRRARAHSLGNFRSRNTPGERAYIKLRLRIVLFTSSAISLTIKLINHLTCMISYMPLSKLTLTPGRSHCILTNRVEDLGSKRYRPLILT